MKANEAFASKHVALIRKSKRAESLASLR